MNDQPFPPATQLANLGTIIVSGSDARSFLQGQLSFDLTRLTPAYVELASINSAQGRVQAVVWLLERTDAIVMILSAGLVDTIVARLKKFVLRAKVSVTAGTDQLLIGEVAGTAVPAAARAHTQQDGVSLIHWPGIAARGLIVGPIGSALSSDTSVDATCVDATWRLENIRAGLPAVYPQTHEAFVAQMLNVDLLQGISFDKGCYTGQEIIARMHFRGQVKRRMLRFAFSGSPPEPGTRVVSEGNHAGDVIDAAATTEGAELLAVINLAQADASLEIDGVPGKLLQRLPLPYEV